MPDNHYTEFCMNTERDCSDCLVPVKFGKCPCTLYQQYIETVTEVIKHYTLGEFIKSPIIRNDLLRRSYAIVIYKNQLTLSLSDIQTVTVDEINHDPVLQEYVISSIEASQENPECILIIAKNGKED